MSKKIEFEIGDWIKDDRGTAIITEIISEDIIYIKWINIKENCINMRHFDNNYFTYKSLFTFVGRQLKFNLYIDLGYLGFEDIGFKDKT